MADLKRCSKCGHETRDVRGLCHFCLGHGRRARPFEPTPDYRNLLSPEALERLRGLEGKR